jgi:hypothetical protein
MRLGSRGRQSLLEGLDRLGFEISPQMMEAAISRTAKLGDLMKKSVDVYTLDQAMDKFDIKSTERIAFKIALEREGLLK